MAMRPLCHGRATTISFSEQSRKHVEFPTLLGIYKVAVRSVNFYAYGLTAALRYDPQDDVVRASIVQYNAD